MRICVLAANLFSNHAEAPVGVGHDVTGLEGPGKARPSGSRLVLFPGAEQRLSGHDVDVDPLLVVAPVLISERRLGSILLGDLEL